MTELTYGQAVLELASVRNPNDLRDLILRVSSSFEDGRTGVLFSGVHHDGTWYGEIVDVMERESLEIQSIRSTDVAKFLDFDRNPELERKLKEIVGGDPLAPGTPAYQFLNGSEDKPSKTKTDGIWDVISRRFASQLRGDVHVLVSPSKELGVFRLTELETLLQNDKVTTIEGIDRAILLQMSKSDGGLDRVKDALAAASFARIEMSGLIDSATGRVGNTAAYLNAKIDDLLAYIESPANLAALQGKLAVLKASLDVPGSTAWVYDGAEKGLRDLRAFSALTEVGKVAQPVAPHLRRVGEVGVALSALFAVSEAEAASSSEEAQAIMERWAFEAVGSEVGSRAAAALAAAAVAAVGATAVVSVPLIIGASIAGGFLGAAAAEKLHVFLNARGESERQAILRRVSELYFGAGTATSVATLPDATAGFYLMEEILKPGTTEANSPASLVSAAMVNLAFRYALVKLNPFVIVQPDEFYQRMHNADGSLDLFDPASGRGLTDDYLLARAKALYTKAALQMNGESVTGGNVYPGGYDYHYLDAGTPGEVAPTFADLALHDTSYWKEQLLFGSAAPEVIRGGAAADMLFGGDGNDWLDGREGGDYLEGGAGRDIYRAGGGDRIFDVDGSGVVMFGDSLLDGGTRDDASGHYQDEAGAFRYTETAAGLHVERVGDGGTLVIENFTNGDLGIQLTTVATTGDDDLVPHPVAGDVDKVIYGETAGPASYDPAFDYAASNHFNLADHIIGGRGSDWVYAWNFPVKGAGELAGPAPDDDLVEGGGGRDFIHGGNGDDRLYATGLDDAAAVAAGGGAEAYAGVTSEGDLVSGGNGNDTLFGSGRFDGLFGGDGDDLIHGGAGDDYIAGAGGAYQAPFEDTWWTVADGRRVPALDRLATWSGVSSDSDTIFAGAGDDIVYGDAHDDTLHGQDGDDWLFGDRPQVDRAGLPLVPGAYHGNDRIAGGDGNDQILGNGGDDTISGGPGDDQIDGDTPLSPGFADDSAHHGRDVIDGGAGNDILVGNGAADILIGGHGNDFLFGDAEALDVALHGDDQLYGGFDADVLIGQGGDDMLFGEQGDDILVGDSMLAGSAASGDDLLSGGAGNDRLDGGAGDDRLSGGEGSDIVWGGAGEDQVTGGAGIDLLDGGAGRDTYWFAVGDGEPVAGRVERIDDSGAEADRIAFASGIGADDLDVQVVEGTADLLISYSASDRVIVTAGLSGTVDAYLLADGASLAFDELITRRVDNARYLRGDAADELVFGSHAGELLDGGAGNDTLVGGAGNDRLRAGPGSDVYLLTAGHGADIVSGTAGFDQVRFSDAVFADVEVAEVGSDLRLSTATSSVTIRKWQAGTVEQLRFADGTVMRIDDILDAVPAAGVAVRVDDAFAAAAGFTAGDDDITVATDNVRLSGSAGDDVYRLSDQYHGIVIDDRLGANTLLIDGPPGLQPYLNRVGSDLVVVLGDDELARIVGGYKYRPAEMYAPDGRRFAGAALQQRINTGPRAGKALEPVSATEDERFEWQLPSLLFYDRDDAVLDITLSMVDAAPWPSWLSYDRTTHTLSGTPGNADVAQLELIARAIDKGGLTAEARFAIDVRNINDAPVVRGGGESWRADTGYRFRVDLAEQVFEDVDAGDRLSFAIEPLGGGGALPDWLALDTASGLLAGIPAVADVGEWTVRLTATDLAGASVSSVATIVVADPEDAVLHSATLGALQDFQVHALTAAGDVDGDGFDDVLVQTVGPDRDAATMRLEPAAPDATSQLWLLYGEPGGWATTPARRTLLSDAAVFTGFSFGVYANALDDGYADIAVQPLGDIDGDGYDDIAVRDERDGVRMLTVWHGRDGGWGDDAGLAETTTFGLGPVDDLARTTMSLHALDWNGDGHADLAFSIDDDTLGRQMAGVVFDAAAWRGLDLDASALAARADVVFVNNADPAASGLERPYLWGAWPTPDVATAMHDVGDVNGDGYDDLFISSDHVIERADWRDPSRTRLLLDKAHRIVFGGPDPLGIDLDALLPGQGVEIVDNGYALGGWGFGGAPVRGVGDINGDGFDDVAVGIANDRLAIVFGGADIAAGVDLSTLDGDNGFSISGLPWTYYLTDGFELSHGDVDGDGLDDIVLGSFAGNSELGQNGIGWVILGRRDGFAADLDVWSLSATQGFRVVTPYPDPAAAWNDSAQTHMQQPYDGVEQVALADINGDGVDDLLKSAVGSGVATIQTLYGRSTLASGVRLGDDADDVLVLDGGGLVYARGGDDLVMISPADQPSEVFAGAGDDEVIVVASADLPAGGDVSVSVHGGDGADVLRLEVPDGASGIRLPGAGVHLGGGAGDDTYVVSPGGIAAGDVYISDTSRDGRGNSLVIGQGFSGSNVRMSFGSLLLSWPDSGLQVHLESLDRENVLAGPRDIDWFEFGDGTRLSYQELLARGFDVQGSNKPDLLEGSSVTDRIDAMSGDDIVIGGAGDDVLRGGRGDDTFRFAAGFGHDHVLESANEGTDWLVFDDAAHDRLWLERSGLDLVWSVVGTSDRVTLDDWFGQSGPTTEFVRSADGRVLADTDVDRLVQAMAGFAKPGSGESDISAAMPAGLEPTLAAVWSTA